MNIKQTRIELTITLTDHQNEIINNRDSLLDSDGAYQHHLLFNKHRLLLAAMLRELPYVDPTTRVWGGNEVRIILPSEVYDTDRRKAIINEEITQTINSYFNDECPQ